jgi:predicted aldo/keto reductase-like oxidoreductase
MTYREIGGTKVSLLGFGCMRFPTLPDGKIDKAQAKEMLELAYKSGVTYFDTAWPYHGGESELVTAEIMKQFPRESFMFATKLPLWEVHSLDDAKRIFEKQLEKLRTDYIDFYLLHAINKERWEAMLTYGVVDWCLEQQKLGRIKKFGFSFHDEYSTFDTVIHYRKWDFCQIQLNYMDTDSQAGIKGYKDCEELGVPVVIMEPVKGGSLATFSDDVTAPLKAVNPDASVASWAMRYVGEMPAISVVLSGMSNMEQVRDNLKTFEDFKPFSETETAAITAHIGRVKGLVNIGCTWCNYCMPCPSGVNIPRIFGLWNDYAKYHNAGHVNWNWTREIPDSQKPKNCIECGACESHCPQSLKIIDGLKQANKEIEEICKQG